MKHFNDYLKKAIKEYDLCLPKNSEIIRFRKLEELIDRIGSRNLEVLLKMPKTERGDILNRLKKKKEIR